MKNLFVRRIFWVFNKLFMVPVFLLGLGPLIVNPLTGYIMVLKTTGNRTGKTRFTPVNYAIWQGNLYCLAGAGKVTHWYRNLAATPALEVILPGRAIAATAEEVRDADERARVIRQILLNGGVAGFFLRLNPYTASDERLLASVEELPVVRLQPTGIGTGANDAGGWRWVLVFAAGLWLIFRWGWPG